MASWSMSSLIGNVDHPLTVVGAQQAQGLRERWNAVTGGLKNPAGKGGKKDEETRLGQWLAAGEVLSSPHTRAVQTAILGLSGHPRVESDGVHLLPSVREVKGVGGIDNIGAAMGVDRIELHARQELHRLEEEDGSGSLSGTANQKCVFGEPAYDLSHGLDERWWNRTWESEADVQLRLTEFLKYVQAHESKSLIVVGHSMFFQALMRRFGGHGILCADPNLPLDPGTDLAREKLPNAGCVALDIEFESDGPIIVTAERMFAQEATPK